MNNLPRNLKVLDSHVPKSQEEAKGAINLESSIILFTIKTVCFGTKFPCALSLVTSKAWSSIIFNVAGAI